MGSSPPPPPPKPRCAQCYKYLCQNCKGCTHCNPCRECVKCLRESPFVPMINISFEDFKNLYQNGKILRIKGKSCVGGSKIPFTNRQIRHFYVQLQMKAHGKTFNYAIEGSRDYGYMKIQLNFLNHDRPSALIDQLEVQNKSFRQLYDYVKQKENRKDYKIYQNNCYHVGIRIIQFLCPNVPNNVIKKIYQEKDKTTQNWWE